MAVSGGLAVKPCCRPPPCVLRLAASRVTLRYTVPPSEPPALADCKGQKDRTVIVSHALAHRSMARLRDFMTRASSIASTERCFRPPVPADAHSPVHSAAQRRPSPSTQPALWSALSPSVCGQRAARHPRANILYIMLAVLGYSDRQTGRHHAPLCRPRLAA